jgi:hypothetical protein
VTPQEIERRMDRKKDLRKACFMGNREHDGQLLPAIEPMIEAIANIEGSIRELRDDLSRRVLDLEDAATGIRNRIDQMERTRGRNA